LVLQGKKNRILFILHFPPPVHGSSVVGSYIKKSQVINEFFDCRYVNLSISATIEDIGKNSFRKFFRYFSLIWQMKRQLLTFRTDLCYFTPTAQGVGFYKDALIIAIVKLFGVKIIYHFHNKGVSTRQNKIFDNILYRFVFINAYVIMLSKHLYSDIKKYVPENRVYYCPNGIPDQEDKRQKAKDKSFNTVVEILFISHLIESKGVYVLLEALKMLKEKDIAFHCNMIGGEKDITENQLKLKIEQTGLDSYILVAGNKYGEEKAKAFEKTDIFVHPSFNDCLPLVVLEAMQHSVPVVSTFEGGIPGVVEDGVSGFLVPQKDSAALAEKVELLIKDPELRQRMGRAGREKYEREYTLETFEKRMNEILEAVIEER
jgi:glycosyltransferase involved in cell wall biosynthesis